MSQPIFPQPMVICQVAGLTLHSLMGKLSFPPPLHHQETLLGSELEPVGVRPVSFFKCLSILRWRIYTFKKLEILIGRVPFGEIPTIFLFLIFVCPFQWDSQWIGGMKKYFTSGFRWDSRFLKGIYRVRLHVWTQEMEQRAQWSAPAWAACCALYSISCVQIWRRTRYCLEVIPDVRCSAKT